VEGSSHSNQGRERFTEIRKETANYEKLSNPPSTRPAKPLRGQRLPKEGQSTPERAEKQAERKKNRKKQGK